MKSIPLTLAALLCGTACVFSQQTTVTWQNTANALFLNGSGAALSQGAAGTNSDGMLIQLGYFSGQTGLGFSGNWIPLTGFGSTLPRTTIGDSSNNNGGGGTGEGNGRFNFLTAFSQGTNVVDVYDPLFDTGNYQTQSSVIISPTTPPDGQVLSIRFYDTTTGTSGMYNTVQNAAWIFAQPSLANPSPTVTIFINGSAGLSFESSGPLFDFRTVIPIPEPSIYVLLGLGAVGLMVGYRRRLKVLA